MSAYSSLSYCRSHVFHPPGPKVLTGKVPFYRVFHDCAVFAQIVQGVHPEIPIDTPDATHRSGLWAIVQQCWEQEPIKRPTLPEIRRRVSAAAEMWDADLGRSGTSDGYVSVPQDTLLSEDSSDAGE